VNSPCNIEQGKEQPVRILFLYYSKTGHTLEAARATAEGIRSAGSEADLVG